jgi:hypothetical protein
VRGCHTKQDIYDEEVIIEVPLKCLITVEMGKETEVRGLHSQTELTYFNANFFSFLRLIIVCIDWEGYNGI